MNNLRRSSAVRIVACGLLGIAAEAALANVTITSTDGRWEATIEDTGGGAGQCVGLRDLDQPTWWDAFVNESKHYVRMGNSLTWANERSVRMENAFHLLSFSSSSTSYTAVLASNTEQGVIAVVHGQMVPGSSGGLRVSLAFADTDAPLLNPVPIKVKPFVYVDMMADSQQSNNISSWSTDHFAQWNTSTGTNNIRWFRARNHASYATQANSLLKAQLDQGMTELPPVNSAIGSFVNTAISFQELNLFQGMTSYAYAIGNQNIAIPDTLGEVPSGGAVSIASDDGRWAASIRTGNGFTDFGAAGEISSVSDFNQSLSTAKFCDEARYFVAAGVGGVEAGSAFRSAFKRLSFLHNPNGPRMTTSLLVSKTHPGLIAIVETKMISGSTGGSITCIKLADTSQQNLHIKPLVYADLNVDNNTQNSCTFQVDRFRFVGTGVGSTTRWFRAAAFHERMGMDPVLLLSWLNNGHIALNNSIDASTGNIAGAFSMHTLPLSGDQPYVLGFAIGNPNIVIPADFVTPTLPPPPACPADIAPVPGDGVVGAADLGVLLGAWGSCNQCAADLNGDNLVNAADLGILLGNWGACQ